MTYQNDFTLPPELLKQVEEQGLNVLPELIRVIINTAMLAERTEHLNAGPYQHTLGRRGYANGFKPKTMQTRVGDINYGIPTFTLEGNLVHFAGFKSHIGFYPTPSGIEKFKKELSVYESAKGSVKFPLDKPIPYALIVRIVKFRVNENLEKAEVKGKKAR